MKEQNRLIAEFMGYKTHPNQDLAFKTSTIGNEKSTINLNTAKYNTSWDWLMPVVEKIESLNWSTELRYTPGIGHNMYFISAGAELNNPKSSSNKIEAVYSAVIFFINWYNQQNQDQ